MERERITIEIEESLLRSAREMAERGGKSEDEIFEAALSAYLGFDILEKVWRRDGLPDEEESLRIAYEELHAMRAEKREAEKREAEKREAEKREAEKREAERRSSQTG